MRQGNTKPRMTKAQSTAYDIGSAVAIVPSALIAMATLLTPEVWKAISILLKAAK